MTVDKRRAVIDELLPNFFRNIVMVKIEPSSGNFVTRGELVELVQIVVTDQMCP